MKIAFVFDTKLIEKNNDFYGMTLTYDFFEERYLTFFDQIIVSTRVEINKNINEPGYCKTNGKNVIVKPIRNYNKVSDAVFKNKNIKDELEKIIKDVDKVIIRMPSVLGILACDICKKNNKDYIIEMVACALDGYMNHSNLFGKIIAPIMYYLTKRKVKKAPRVIYVTDKFLQRRYPTKGKSYACSDVKLQENNCSLLEKRIEKIINVNMEELKILTVANVGMKYKGHKYVLQAMAKLKKDNKKVPQYYLAGNGNSDYLKKLAKRYNISENVIFLGSLKHEEVFKQMQECDIYIQPSLQEGLPRAVIEAMSVAMPVYGTDCGGIPELISNDAIFKKRNAVQIIKILKNITSDKLIKLSKENYEKSKQYNYETLGKKRKKIMEDFSKYET